VELLGIRLVGVNAETGQKLLLTIGVVVGLLLVRALAVVVARSITGQHRNERAMFWLRQGASIVATLVAVVALLSIWFDDPQRLTTGLGIFGAGLAFALQRVVTALAGYVVIMRGNTFTVGDRITMGGVRGDVIALTFTQTKIMEMGQPPAVQGADPAMWVQSRQFTGRIVTVTNDKVFDEPVYNYTREFPFIWEEMMVPIPYRADRQRAEEDPAVERGPVCGAAGSGERAGSAGAGATLLPRRERPHATRLLPADRQLARAHGPLRRPGPRRARPEGCHCPRGSEAVRGRLDRDREHDLRGGATPDDQDPAGRGLAMSGVPPASEPAAVARRIGL
jgi:hypothetical protein